MRIHALMLGAIVVASACACRAQGTDLPGSEPQRSVEPASAPMARTSPAVVSLDDDRSIDPAIAPVARSHLSPEEEAVLASCWVADFGIDSISGMGLVPRARDVPRYVPLTGSELVLQTEDPAWVVSYEGVVEFPRGLGWARNPVCVVVHGIPTVFAPEQHGRGEVVVNPEQPSQPPDLRLPPLAQ